jgi:hypothetical protein
MRDFVFWAIMTSYRKKEKKNIRLQFSEEKKLTLIRFLASTLSPLGLTFLNSMLVLFAI